MEGHRPALPLVADLDLEAENVAELPLKRLKIRIDGLCGCESSPAGIGAAVPDFLVAALALPPGVPIGPCG